MEVNRSHKTVCLLQLIMIWATIIWIALVAVIPLIKLTDSTDSTAVVWMKLYWPPLFILMALPTCGPFIVVSIMVKANVLSYSVRKYKIICIVKFILTLIGLSLMFSIIFEMREDVFIVSQSIIVLVQLGALIAFSCVLFIVEMLSAKKIFQKNNARLDADKIFY